MVMTSLLLSYELLDLNKFNMQNKYFCSFMQILYYICNRKYNQIKIKATSKTATMYLHVSIR